MSIRLQTPVHTEYFCLVYIFGANWRFKHKGNLKYLKPWNPLGLRVVLKQIMFVDYNFPSQKKKKLTRIPVLPIFDWLCTCENVVKKLKYSFVFTFCSDEEGSGSNTLKLRKLYGFFMCLLLKCDLFEQDLMFICLPHWSETVFSTCRPSLKRTFQLKCSWSSWMLKLNKQLLWHNGNYHR